MRTRRLIEEDQLDEFMAYCETQGWKPKRTQGPMETLRMSRARSVDLVIGQKAHPGTSGVSRYPIYDEASRMYDEWQKRSAGIGTTQAAA